MEQTLWWYFPGFQVSGPALCAVAETCPPTHHFQIWRLSLAVCIHTRVTTAIVAIRSHRFKIKVSVNALPSKLFIYAPVTSLGSLVTEDLIEFFLVKIHRSYSLKLNCKGWLCEGTTGANSLSWAFLRSLWFSGFNFFGFPRWTKSS